MSQHSSLPVVSVKGSPLGYWAGPTGRATTEASGGVSLQTVRPIAQAGVDWISVGALTHSAPALDLALDFE